MDYLPVNPGIIETYTIKHVENDIAFEIFVRKSLSLKIEGNNVQKIADAFEQLDQMQEVINLDNQQYKLIFNKFNISQRHYLLISKHFIHQKQLLDLDSFTALSETIQKTNLHSFFNCGQLSGSSQPRRHFQLVQLQNIPLEKLLLDEKIQYLEDRLFYVEYFDKPSNINLYSAYMILLQKCQISITEPIHISDIPHDYENLQNYPSYNTIEQSLESDFCQLAINDYSLIIGSYYIAMAKRQADNNVNSISLTGQLFTSNQEQAQQKIKEGIFNIYKSCLSKNDHSQ